MKCMKLSRKKRGVSMPSEKKLSRTKAKRKNLIVDNAYRMFIDNGISATSMNDIAEACDITRRTIYNYFDSKSELLNYLMIELTEEIDNDFHMRYDNTINAVENMRNLLRRNFESYYIHMETFLFITQVRMHLSYSDLDVSYEDRSNSMHRAFISEFEDLISIGYEDESMSRKEIDMYDISKMIYQSLYGYLTNITIETKIKKEIYDKKCRNFENMIIDYLSK